MIRSARIYTGATTSASYRPSEDPMYQHNCYVEALPPVFTATRAADLMRREPAYHEHERQLPPELRLLAVQRIANYIDPMWVFLDIEQRFTRLIRNGYLARNPLSPEWRKQMLAGFPKIDKGEDIPGYNAKIRSTASGYTILGISGIGKSTAVESVLSLYPQVIVHTEYNGRPFDQQQLVWLKLDCSHDGSVRGLCTMFFMVVDQLLGTRYYEKYASNKRRTVDELLPLMAKTAAVQGLGVLVIDEIQRLSLAKSGGAEQMLNFFVDLVNVIGVPVVLVGTYKAYDILTLEFAQARRSAGQGDLVWPTLQFDEDWSFFLEGIWRYQWTLTPTALTEELSQAIYDESQGITDIVVKLYMLAQWWVIGEKDERLTPEVFRTVAKESLQLAKPILNALRTGNQELLRKIPDVQLPFSGVEKSYENAMKRVASHKKVKSRLGSRPQDVSQQIFTQLVLAGVEEGEARSCAEQALAFCGEGAGLKELLVAAFQFTTSKPPAESAPKEAPRSKSSPPIPASDDMREIVKKGKGAHEALTKAGLIKPSDEFLE